MGIVIHTLGWSNIHGDGHTYMGIVIRTWGWSYRHWDGQTYMGMVVYAIITGNKMDVFRYFLNLTAWVAFALVN